MKKLISFLAVLALTACLLPACKGSHKHCLCGGSLAGHSCSNVGYTELKQENFENVTADTYPVSLHNNVYRLAAGSYYLSGDIVTREQVLVLKDKVDLCLNGHRFAGTYSERTGVYSRIFAVSGGTLNVSDCTGGGNIQGGYVASGAAILVQGSGGSDKGSLGVLNLYSGIIKGGRAQAGHGGTVSITGGTVNVYGGEITGGAASADGGTIHVAAGQSLNIYGGVIGRGSARLGDCIYADYSSYVKIGGTAKVDEIYLPKNAFISVGEGSGYSSAIVTEVPGVFARDISSDVSGCFTGGSVTYDPDKKTLSIE